MSMELDEYIKSRNEVVDVERRYNIYRHVQYRLYERFGISRLYFSMKTWEKMSHACATRQIEVVHRQGHTIFCKSNFHGDDVMWVYSREYRCIMTVYLATDKMFKTKYAEEERKMCYRQGRRIYLKKDQRYAVS